MSEEQIRHARALLAQPNETVSSIARLLGVSRATIYKYIPELKDGGRQAVQAPAAPQTERASLAVEAARVIDVTPPQPRPIERAESVERVDAGDIEERIREAYWRLARFPQDWIYLSRLRALVDDVDREVVDAELCRMERLADVHLVSEADQKRLTLAERAAAVAIGEVPKHLLAIESR